MYKKIRLFTKLKRFFRREICVSYAKFAIVKMLTRELKTGVFSLFIYTSRYDTSKAHFFNTFCIAERKQLKKLFIPMLLILKLFKLKLLLFLPLILGLASFKKFLGFLAILIPGKLTCDTVKLAINSKQL